MFSNDWVYTPKTHVGVICNTSLLFTFDRKFHDRLVTNFKDHMQKRFSEIEKRVSDRDAPNQEVGDRQNQQMCS